MFPGTRAGRWMSVCVCACVCVCGGPHTWQTRTCAQTCSYLVDGCSQQNYVHSSSEMGGSGPATDGDGNLCVFVEPASENSNRGFLVRVRGQGAGRRRGHWEEWKWKKREREREEKVRDSSSPLKSARYWLAGIGAVNTTNNGPDTREWERPDQTRWKTAMLHKRFFFTLQIDYWQSPWLADPANISPSVHQKPKLCWAGTTIARTERSPFQRCQCRQEIWTFDGIAEVFFFSCVTQHQAVRSLTQPFVIISAGTGVLQKKKKHCMYFIRLIIVISWEVCSYLAKHRGMLEHCPSEPSPVCSKSFSPVKCLPLTLICVFLFFFLFVNANSLQPIKCQVWQCANW